MFKTWGKIRIRIGIRTITNQNTGKSRKTDADGLQLATLYSNEHRKCGKKPSLKPELWTGKRFDADPNPHLNPISVFLSDLTRIHLHLFSLKPQMSDKWVELPSHFCPAQTISKNNPVLGIRDILVRTRSADPYL
jgi:hypothetical protein